MEYYAALQQSTKNKESTIFIQFMLETIKEATVEFTKKIKPVKQLTELRIDIAKNHYGKEAFSRREYLQLHPNISTATGSRDLAVAVQKGLLKKIGEKATTKYKFI